MISLVYSSVSGAVHYIYRSLFSQRFSILPVDSTVADTPDSDFFTARPSQVLGERYEVRAKLGGGVYSTTYLVIDKMCREWVFLFVYASQGIFAMP